MRACAGLHVFLSSSSFSSVWASRRRRLFFVDSGYDGGLVSSSPRLLLRLRGLRDSASPVFYVASSSSVGVGVFIVVGRSSAVLDVGFASGETFASSSSVFSDHFDASVSSACSSSMTDEHTRDVSSDRETPTDGVVYRPSIDPTPPQPARHATLPRHARTNLHPRVHQPTNASPHLLFVCSARRSTGFRRPSRRR